MLDATKIGEGIRQYFRFQPTHDQAQVIHHLSRFLVSEKNNPVYLMKGYAGTGKTSLLAALSMLLNDLGLTLVLLAPTGRAAKVMQNYSSLPAFTIHKYIYSFTETDQGYQIHLSKNNHKNTVFIVDEASMIANHPQEVASSYAGGLLTDLMSFVFQNPNNKLLLVGDQAQLPPVGWKESPALDLGFIQATFPVTSAQSLMTEVKRQSRESGILDIATHMRLSIQHKTPLRCFDIQKTKQVVRLDANELEENLITSYGDDGAQQAITICYSNFIASQMNQQIRNRILFRDSILEAGDSIMVVRNNYFWLRAERPQQFLANGDLLKVRRVIQTDHAFGFDFADAEVELLQGNDKIIFETTLHLGALHTSWPALTADDRKKLFQNWQQQQVTHNQTKPGLKFSREDKYLQALEVKFSYAVTAHKAQGGQWDEVYLLAPFKLDLNPGEEIKRWLYTAITRARKKLFLTNFPDDFFCKSYET